MNVILKQLLRTIVVAAVALAWTGHVMAEEGDAKPKRTAPKQAKIECEIVSIDVDGKSIEIKTDAGTEKLVLTAKAKVLINGEEKSLSDLKAGDKCACTVYERKDGRSVSRIVVGEDPAKGGKKKEGY